MLLQSKHGFSQTLFTLGKVISRFFEMDLEVEILRFFGVFQYYCSQPGILFRFFSFLKIN